MPLRRVKPETVMKPTREETERTGFASATAAMPPTSPSGTLRRARHVLLRLLTAAKTRPNTTTSRAAPSPARRLAALARAVELPVKESVQP